MNKESQIEIEKDNFDKLIEIIGWLALIVLILLPLIYINQLPDSVPIRINGSTQPNGMGRKYLIWTIPSIGFITYLLIWKLLRQPRLFKHPKINTRFNMTKKYNLTIKALRILNTIIAIVLTTMTYHTIITLMTS